MAVSLFTHEQITTTLPKAKSVQPFVERLITLARRGDLAARRRVMRLLGQDDILVHDADDPDVPRNAYGEIDRKGGRREGPRVIKHLFEQIGPRYADRTGGCTRIIKLATHRIGDGADLCVLQLVSDDDKGPQVAGQYSRRREKANRRMAFAARLRKGGEPARAGASQATASAEAPPASEPADSTEPANAPPASEPKRGDEQA